ncbi:MAG: CHAT domain-containing protein, partial [Proteobacteria bacterium]|nr:CHAT domain-containing protein [Pseudomonadota bacterium]
EALGFFRESVRLLTSERETQTIARQVADERIRTQVGAFSGLAEAAWRVGGGSASKAQFAEESFEASQRAWTTAAGSALQRMSARLAAGDSDLGRRIRRQQEATDRILALHQEDNNELKRWSEVQNANPLYVAAQQRFREISNEQMRNNAAPAQQQTALVGQLQALLARCPPGQKKTGCEKADAEREKISKELAQVSQRSAGPSPAFLAAIRDMQAAEAQLPGYREFTAARNARIQEQSKLEQVATAERKAIVAAFPAYVALVEPEPLKFRAVQALLGPSEAVVTMLVGPDQTFVWAVSKERTEWARVDLGQRALAAEVTALRLGLDPLAGPLGADGNPLPMPSFDLVRSYELYRRLLGPIEGVIRDKAQLILVPTGPLTSLPFHVLLTAPPTRGATGADAIRSAPWLVRRHATSVLPSVPSLSALRTVGASLKAAEPFLGIGDPALTGPPPARGQSRSTSKAVAAYWRNGHPDLRALSELMPLPETAAELKAIAAALKAPPNSLLLRNDATETRIRKSALEHYRVIHFATHGLIAGELSGLAEPALVLTPPAQPSEQDDGLLTASEVAGLKLAADWVVLSACNTASGSEVGAEALSGLARAFFFAGAKALLVSHWAVNSDAAVWLTTGTFDALTKDPQIGRAEGFRRTMLAMIDAGLPPSAWAPFVIVGEGTGR